MRRLIRRGADPPILIGTVHLLATPGSPGWQGEFDALLGRAREDAAALAEGGVDALLVENYGDAPFFRDSVPAETVAAITRAVAAVRDQVGELALGVNVLRNDARAALGICAATGASFLRVNVLSGAMVCDQGVIEGRAAELLRERARLCPQVALLADVHVKHATPLGSETLAEAADDAWQRGGADALIVTGSRTGEAPSARELESVRERVAEAPLLVGSGLDVAGCRELLRLADGAIVGTSVKRDGSIREPVDSARVRRLREAVDAARREG